MNGLDENTHCLVGFSQGALVALAVALTCSRVRLVIASGCPRADWITKLARVHHPQLEVHLFAGQDDGVVSVDEVRELASLLTHQCGIHVKLHVFSGKHAFPTNSAMLEMICNTVEGMAHSVDSQQHGQLRQVQEDELMLLESMYGLDETLKVLVMPGEDTHLHCQVQIHEHITLDCRYVFGGGLMGKAIIGEQSNWTSQTLQPVIDRILYDDDDQQQGGEGLIFTLLSALQEWLADHPDGPPNHEQALVVPKQRPEEEEEETSMIALVESSTAEARALLKQVSREQLSQHDTRRGHWRFTIGLLGKPSAGKSSFFNATVKQGKRATRKVTQEAQVGAQPFTTIDPNIALTDFEFHPANDKDKVNPFQLAVQIKDVAGLVPGAYRGLGKGNRFLNDLLDASVLLHICDASGTSDDGGRQVNEEGNTRNVNPLQVTRDALWVLREIHLWIYNNVTAKWPTESTTSNKNAAEQQRIRLQYAQRVCELFGGYHAQPSFVKRAAKLAELDLEQAPQFTARDRHRLVAFFIGLRFPVVMVLNKSDVVMQGRNGGPQVMDEIEKRCVEIMGKQELVVKTSCRDATGIQDALNLAVNAAHPLVCTCRLNNATGSDALPFLMYPGSTVFDLYETCLKQQVVSGDFVRAAEDHEGKTLSRDALLSKHCMVRIATNVKKVG